MALVNMPWARSDAPSIQCGVLQTAVTAHGYRASTLYCNLELSRMLGPAVYDVVAEAPAERVHLFGEWLFGVAAFEASDDGAYRAEYPEVEELCKSVGLSWPEVLRLRSSRLPAWLDEIASRPLWGRFDVVGFTSTFVQNVASIALASRLKRHWPDLTMVFGGANYDGEMGAEYLRVLPCIDYVVSGEGETTFIRLLDALARGERPVDVAGLLTRGPDGAVAAALPALPGATLEQAKIPDYDDYFATVDQLGRRAAIGSKKIRLLAEFSKGCWWGQKHHCTFCGLNALSMQYRSKGSDQAFDELVHLVERHGVNTVDAVDNILDMSYFRGFLTRLEQAEWDLDIFFEVKANLTRAQVGQLAAAGVRRLQPGLESLSTNVLRLMRKGSTRLLNVRLLKWARYYGVDVAWNILAGFPGEKDEDYYEQARLMPALTHLAPPGGLGRIWLERFSPNFTDERFQHVEPRGAYRHAYPIAGVDLSKIAYFFDYKSQDRAVDDALDAVRVQIDAWREAWSAPTKPQLDYQRAPNRILLRDRRPGRSVMARLDGWQAQAYELCGDTPRSASRIAAALADSGTPVSEDRVAAFLDFCVNEQICLEEAGLYLALALPQRRVKV
ncbi:RiPP maturation radical SAM C-methyltransferase [Dactylosporangium fulvum]|uniref:RiPP maturation radical SAM C-methyltransferase n=1 Tax=Dactylosporangium fulvum TaxID=53359 RepID=UPI0031E375D7